jgi:hypothetical protein
MEESQQPVPDDCVAFRLIKPEWVKPDGQRPTSQAFQDHPRSGAMSVYLEDEIHEAGRSPVELLDLWPGYRLCHITVGRLREEFGQVIDRVPDDSFPGHALVRDPAGKRSAGTRSRLASAVTWYIKGD